MDLGLTNKTAFVSGASGGIGQAISRQFSAEGANVAVHYNRNHQSASALVDELGSDRSIAVAADLNDEEAVDGALRQTIEKFGSIDVLVACAGVWPVEHRPVHEMTMEQWQATLGNNLTSAFLCCRGFIRAAIDAEIEDPAIVLIGSTAGLVGEAGHGDYAVSKSGLTGGLMLTLKNELARVARLGRVNAVCPGWVVTPMAEKFTGDDGSIKQALSTIAMRKVASATDIANAVLFLSSTRAAGHITGQALTVSGGMEGRKLYNDDELDVETAIPRNDA